MIGVRARSEPDPSATARCDVGCKLFWRRQRPPYEAKQERNHNVGEVRTLETYTGLARQNQTRHVVTGYTQNKTGAKNVGNSTSSAPVLVETQVRRTRPREKLIPPPALRLRRRAR